MGDCAVRDVGEEALTRRLQWLLVLANQPGLVGTAHRFLATLAGPAWVEPTPALAEAAASLHWNVWINRSSPRATGWPHLAPEWAYSGDVLLEPEDPPPPPGAVWTDGSLDGRGGAAAVQPSSDRCLLLAIPAPRSSTHCELVALGLVHHFVPSPPLVLTDSLTSLRLIASWSRRSTAAVLACADRQEVRAFLFSWQGHPPPRPGKGPRP